MSADLPDEAWLAALVTLPGLGPARLRAVLERRSPAEAWGGIAAGAAWVGAAAAKRGLASSWRSAAAAIDVEHRWLATTELGIGVLGAASAAYPATLAEDPEPPAVLFTRGDPTCITPTVVGVVGTRRCTRYGIDLAHELGHLLAQNGVQVVSGLARGIDAAAHQGALEHGGAPPVAVVGTALDNPYPRENRALWERVAEAGVVCSETPVGASPERWRFPARNRIIAGLAAVLVVIESHDTGGSLYTAAQALDRGKPVLAVPGPIRSPASLGCNRLLADGCHPLCELDDVLVALGLTGGSVQPPAPVAVDEFQRRVLDAVGWQPVLLDQLVSRLGAPVPAVAAAIESLQALGVLASRGPWFERTSHRVVRAGSNDSSPWDSAHTRPHGAP